MSEDSISLSLSGDADIDDNISISTTESEEVSELPSSSDESEEDSEYSEANDSNYAEESEDEVLVKPKKSKWQKSREEAFKETDLAGNDPALLDHRKSRRALAERLENDPKFRKKYLKQQERARAIQARREDGSYVDSEDVEDAIDAIHTIQRQRFGDYSSDDSYSRSCSRSRSRSSYGIADGISHDGTCDDGTQFSIMPRRELAPWNSRAPEDVGPPAGKFGIYVQNLTLHIH